MKLNLSPLLSKLRKEEKSLAGRLKHVKRVLRGLERLGQSVAGKPRRKKRSAAVRRRMAAAQRKRWAKQKSKS